MLARMRKSMDDKDQGFTLIELLVVMIIIGILAAIAIPVFLNQRKKAQDSAAKADVSTVGKEVATYYVDGTSSPVLSQTAATATVPARYVLTGGGVASDLGKSSTNVVLGTSFLSSDIAWCVSVTNPKGDKAVAGYKYSAAGGLAEGVCASAAG